MLTSSAQDVNEKPTFLNNTYSARIPNSVPYKYPVITVQVEYLSVLRNLLKDLDFFHS